MDELSNLVKYNYISISKGCSETLFSRPVHLVDEGSFYRLAELHIINKGNVESCVIDEKKAVINYKNGDVITLRMV